MIGLFFVELLKKFSAAGKDEVVYGASFSQKFKIITICLKYEFYEIWPYIFVFGKIFRP